MGGVANGWSMSRYFFHIRDGLILIPDEEGIECRTMQAVEEEARASARDLAETALRNRSAGITASIQIEDDRGNKISMIVPQAWVN